MITLNIITFDIPALPISVSIIKIIVEYSYIEAKILGIRITSFITFRGETSLKNIRSINASTKISLTDFIIIMLQYLLASTVVEEITRLCCWICTHTAHTYIYFIWIFTKFSLTTFLSGKSFDAVHNIYIYIYTGTHIYLRRKLCHCSIILVFYGPTSIQL